MTAGVWPPTVTDVRADAGLPDTGADPSDAAISSRLAAAVEYVQTVRPEFNYDSDPLSCLPAPTASLWQGAVMITVRLIARRRSQDGIVFMGQDQGATRIGSVDPDIDRVLGIGRYREAAFG
jgi:hypothetical protein